MFMLIEGWTQKRRLYKSWPRFSYRFSWSVHFLELTFGYTPQINN